jgi:short-subunit dehydrogenase
MRSGSIINIASVAGLRGGYGPHAYTAAKFGVIGLTKSASLELAETQYSRERNLPGGNSDRHLCWSTGASCSY